ncbi:hypothetical protein K2X05_03900 [bacterium]|nr:hypothetical protein [bacterium]
MLVRLILFVSTIFISLGSNAQEIHPDGFYYLIVPDKASFWSSPKVVRAEKDSSGQFVDLTYYGNDPIIAREDILGSCNPNIKSYGWRLSKSSFFLGESYKDRMYIVGSVQIEGKEHYCIYKATSFGIQDESTLFTWEDLKNEFKIREVTPTIQIGHFKLGNVVQIHKENYYKGKLQYSTTHGLKISFIDTLRESPKVRIYFDGFIYSSEGRPSYPIDSILIDPKRPSVLTDTSCFNCRKEYDLVEISPLDSQFKKGETVCYKSNNSVKSSVIQKYTITGYIIDGKEYKDADLKKISDCHN